VNETGSSIHRNIKRGVFGTGFLLAISLVVTACEREVRPFQELEVASASSQKPMGTTLYAGPKPPTPEVSPFQENAYGIAEGKRLFTQYNCVGCHANGGGGMGPPLMGSSREHFCHDRRGAAERDAVVAQQDPGLPGVAARGLCPVNERAGADRRPSRPE
jgi:hypothetical protein